MGELWDAWSDCWRKGISDRNQGGSAGLVSTTTVTFPI